MLHRYYELPSMTGLEAFEASARHLSFKLAASELNVTPGEICQQINALEDELGVPLIVKSETCVMLTSSGIDFYNVLANSLSNVSNVVEGIKRGDRSLNVTIASKMRSRRCG
ncbi:LysR family transcriptional regulator [Mesorhizobium sp. MSK_1335]|uniref:LysR family transcriptional regulator n=1 Tax=Mesorhizobium montanum TaxID=3072323 RepID=A0ABU4ZUS4_9HYPH|nr:LysR family transcriptional regulator [Mesorhizobium sp. MSK_1335]MDX8529157.1 LysR family transcriptional regulator [Mesorhizobium sp. MSK_1335]